VTGLVTAFALTVGFVAQASGGRLVAGDESRVCESVSIDSRTMKADALFIAIAGPNFDGHAFVVDVIARGAAAVLVGEQSAGAAREAAAKSGAGVIVVADTLDALQSLARAVRRQSGAGVVAITGSAGKTTTKEITADLLSAKYKVYRNVGNLNNHIGLPLSLLELRHGYDLAVVELGMNHAGEIRTLMRIAEPEYRVWTNVGDAHIGNFGSRDSIADAKGEVVEGANERSVLVANADDPLVMARTRGFAGEVVTFGESVGADVRALNIQDHGFDGIEADVDFRGTRRHLKSPLAGRGNLMNLLAALVVAGGAEVPPDAIRERISALKPVARRGEITMLADGARVVDDSYNASPAAVALALETLRATPAKRRVAVLGEMRELGDQARALHVACGRAAAMNGVDLLVAIGGIPADGFAQGALESGFSGGHIHRFWDSAAAADAVPDLIESGDLVLVKGSRGTRTDLVVDRLKARG
jgi:UDP-N-acetylmuramoyl-tripeptide--D-alanyl-D-alanine ligase